MLTFQLAGPDGGVVHNETESWAKHRRSFDFTAEQTGEYVLYVNGVTQHYTGNDTTWIKIMKNDHSLLLQFIGI